MKTSEPEDEQLCIAVDIINNNICDTNPLDKSISKALINWHCLTYQYGTESFLTPLMLKLIMTRGIHTEHPSVGMLSPFQPIGIFIEPWGILVML